MSCFEQQCACVAVCVPGFLMLWLQHTKSVALCTPAGCFAAVRQRWLTAFCHQRSVVRQAP
jgi:hypothetical protein